MSTEEAFNGDKDGGGDKRNGSNKVDCDGGREIVINADSCTTLETLGNEEFDIEGSNTMTLVDWTDTEDSELCNLFKLGDTDVEIFQRFPPGNSISLDEP